MAEGEGGGGETAPPSPSFTYRNPSHSVVVFPPASRFSPESPRIVNTGKGFIVQVSLAFSKHVVEIFTAEEMERQARLYGSFLQTHFF